MPTYKNLPNTFYICLTHTDKGTHVSKYKNHGIPHPKNESKLNPAHISHRHFNKHITLHSKMKPFGKNKTKKDKPFEQFSRGNSLPSLIHNLENQIKRRGVRHNIIILHLSHKIKQLGRRSIGHQISSQLIVVKPHIGLIRLPSPIQGLNPKLKQLLHLAPALRSHPIGKHVHNALDI